MRRVMAVAVSGLLIAGSPVFPALAQGSGPPRSQAADEQGDGNALRRLDQAAQRLSEAVQALRDASSADRRDAAVQEAQRAVMEARNALGGFAQDARGGRGWPFEAERPEGRAQGLLQALDEARQAVRQGERDRAGSAIDRAGRALDSAGLGDLEEHVVGAWLQEAERAVRQGDRRRTWHSLQQARWAVLGMVRQDRS